MNNKTNRLIDYHVHPDWSFDAAGSTEDYVKKAIEIGIPGLCFTPHYYTLPHDIEKFGIIKYKGETVSVLKPWITDYINEISELKNKYREIRIYSGLEIDYSPEIEKDLNDFLSDKPDSGMEEEGHHYKRPVDFVIGSIHSVNGLDIMVREEMVKILRTDRKEFLNDYFSLILKMVEWGKIDTVAHLYGYLRYAVNEFNPPEDVNKDLLRDIFKIMGENNIAIEISSALVRQTGWGLNPDIETLKLAKKCGVKYFSFASDAHTLDTLGYMEKEIRKLAEQTGLTEYPEKLFLREN